MRRTKRLQKAKQTKLAKLTKTEKELFNRLDVARTFEKGKYYNAALSIHKKAIDLFNSRVELKKENKKKLELELISLINTLEVLEKDSTIENAEAKRKEVKDEVYNAFKSLDDEELTRLRYELSSEALEFGYNVDMREEFTNEEFMGICRDLPLKMIDGVVGFDIDKMFKKLYADITDVVSNINELNPDFSKEVHEKLKDVKSYTDLLVIRDFTTYESIKLLGELDELGELEDEL